MCIFADNLDVNETFEGIDKWNVTCEGCGVNHRLTLEDGYVTYLGHEISKEHGLIDVITPPSRFLFCPSCGWKFTRLTFKCEDGDLALDLSAGLTLDLSQIAG